MLYYIVDCPVIFFQAIVGSIVGAPMNPVIASPMFFLSYARPVKFWEKNYKFVKLILKHFVLIYSVLAQNVKTQVIPD